MKKTNEQLIEIENRLYTYAGEDRMLPVKELAEHLGKQTDSFKFMTGIPSLDRICDGVEAGELIIVTGPTGEGKTTLLMSITQNIAEANIESAWFTLEVTPRQFINKLQQKSPTLPHFYLPRQNADNTLDWVEERIIEAKVKYNIKAVFIDHIHQLFSLEKMKGNVSLELGDMLAKIKDIAITHNLTIFLIAHSKDNTLNMRAEPRKEDIRDSGLISRLADTIIGVWRTTNEDNGQLYERPKQLSENDNRSKVRILKNRRTGICGGFVMIHANHYLKEFDGFVTERKVNEPLY
jgi:replicative DNA helicase